MKVVICDYRNKKAKPRGFVYVGRWMSGYERSPLGNPHSVGQCHMCGTGTYHTRGEAVQLYRRWLWGRIQAGDEAVLAALRAITDESVLGCWCVTTDAPLDVEECCHAQVIIRAARWLAASTPGRQLAGGR
jgi:hypothetical protein